MTSIKKDIERLSFYRFWRWEFQRRNKEYIDEYGKFIRIKPGGFGEWISPTGETIPSNLRFEAQTFFEKFQRMPKNPKKNLFGKRVMSSKLILKKVLNNNFDITRMVPQNDLHETFKEYYDFAIKIESYQLPILGFELANNQFRGIKKKSSKPNMTLSFDFTEDIELLLREFKYRYYQINFYNIMGKPNLNKEKQFDKNEKTLLQELEGFLLSNNRLRLDMGNRPRAIGLWLWDKVANVNDNTKKWNKVNDLIQSDLKDIIKKIEADKNVEDDGKLIQRYVKNMQHAYKCVFHSIKEEKVLNMKECEKKSVV